MIQSSRCALQPVLASVRLHSRSCGRGLRRAFTCEAAAAKAQFIGRIKTVRTTPILLEYKVPFFNAYGVQHGAALAIVEVETEAGVIGYGECIATPTAAGVQAFVNRAARDWQGQSVFQSRRLIAAAYQDLFVNAGTCSSKRFSGQILSGLEMALWDAAGRSVGLPVSELLGGRVRDTMDFFGFAQGSSAEAIAEDAQRFVADGYDVIYVKLGRGDALDIDIVTQVRRAIGPACRLRVDPNEAWDPLKFGRMAREIEKAGGPIEFIEQPTKCESISALAQVRARSPVAIAADQCVFTPEDTLDVVKQQACDVIVLGLHETGGITRFLKAAAIAEAAGLNICIHGLYESGISTYAHIQLGAVIPNLDDGNQYMNHLIKKDIVVGSGLSLKSGRIEIPTGPGLGFEIDKDALRDAAAAFKDRGLW